MPVGGAEDFALAVAPHLGPEFEPHFVCLREPGPLGEEARAAGWPVHLAPFYTSRRVNPLNFRRFARWLVAEGISLVHSQNHHAHIFATRAAKAAGLASVVQQQKTLAAMGWRRRMQLRGSLRRADRILALSAETARDFSEAFAVPASKLAVVPNAIDRGQFSPAPDPASLRSQLGLPPGGILLGTAARLHHDKNHAAIIAALPVLRAGGADMHAVFLGEGPLRRELEDLAAAQGVRDRVIFAGRRRPVAPWLQALDFFVLPSTWEGQPLALLQAMACGIPVVASRIEGNIAVLGAGHPGLFPPHDTAALVRLLSDDALRPRLLAHQARQSVPYGDDVASSLKAVYESVLS